MVPRTANIPRRGLIRLCLLVALIVLANIAAHWIVDALSIEIRPTNEEFVHRLIMASAFAYAVLLAIPFVPGVEIGLTIIGMLGPRIVLLVYVCTLAGLSLSFLVGRLLPFSWIIGLFSFLKLQRTTRLLTALEPMDMDARLDFLVSRAPNRLMPFLLRQRYLALAVLLNLPGNIVIGGGGGICLIAGLSRLVSLPGFLITIVLAVAPVPLAIVLFDIDFAP